MSGQPGQPQPAPMLPPQGLVAIGQTTPALTTGPIPPPEQLAAYDQIVPGAANRILNAEMRQTLSAILRRSDEVLGTTPETDLNYMFLHTLINYARAKQESRGALARIREAISIETHRLSQQIDETEIRARFVNLLQRRFRINPQEANELFQVLKQDAE